MRLRLCSEKCDLGESQADYEIFENLNRFVVVWIDCKGIMAGGNDFVWFETIRFSLVVGFSFRNVGRIYLLIYLFTLFYYQHWGRSVSLRNMRFLMDWISSLGWIIMARWLKLYTACGRNWELWNTGKILVSSWVRTSWRLLREDTSD